MEEQRRQGTRGNGSGSEAGAQDQQQIRTERALNLLAQGQIRFQPDGGQGWLALEAEGEAHHVGPDHCDCEDFIRRCAPMRIRCKHMEALRVVAETLPKSGPPESKNGDRALSGAALKELLGAPFPAEAVHWKPQKVSPQGSRALAVAYLDAREVAGRLDEVVGPLGWQILHQVLGDQVMTGIGIRDPANGSWVWKWDGGFVGRAEEDQRDPGGGNPVRRLDAEEKARKGTLSDGLKRAAVLWGIGRYLYRLPKVWVAYDRRTRSLAATPRLPPWALPAAGREPHTGKSEKEGGPPPAANSPAGEQACPPTRAGPGEAPGPSLPEGSEARAHPSRPGAKVDNSTPRDHSVDPADQREHPVRRPIDPEMPPPIDGMTAK